MKITWIGQAGLLFDNGKTKIMIDPYLSNSVEKVNPLNFRRQPVDKQMFSVEPDVMIFTHDHLDHYDPETAPHFLQNTNKKMLVLCPTSVWQKARTFGSGHNYVEFNRGTVWTEKEFRFTAVKASHSDSYAIGVIIEDVIEKIDSNLMLETNHSILQQWKFTDYEIVKRVQTYKIEIDKVLQF